MNTETVRVVRAAADVQMRGDEGSSSGQGSQESEEKFHVSVGLDD